MHALPTRPLKVRELTDLRSIRGRRRRDRGRTSFAREMLKATFPLSYFSVTKSTKSHQGGLTPSSLKTSVRRARVSRASHAWQVRATKDKSKICGLAVLCGFSHTTRANISHEGAEQIRARIVCTPAESAWRGLTHMRSMCVGVAETGHRG